jgi:hypothetical protein
MIRSLSVTLLSSFALLAVACGGSSESAPSNAATTGPSGGGSSEDAGSKTSDDGGAETHIAASTLSYQGSCGPTACSGSPDGDSTGNATCAPTSGGPCGWTPGSPPSAGANGTTSYTQCAASECPATSEIGCGEGFDQGETQCGRINGGACTSTITCTAHDTGKACPVANGCGDTEPALAPLCDGGVGGSLECRQTTVGCAWEPKCP